MLWLLLTCVLWAFSPQASLIQPNDLPLKTRGNAQTRFFYAEDGRNAAEILGNHHDFYLNSYERSFGWRLDERMDLILASSRNQQSNAFATIQPNLKTFWYPSPYAAENYAVANWGPFLDAHETAHLYQLNAKAPEMVWFKKGLGNVILTAPLIWPLFVHPNALLPLSFPEGNAVLNESRFGLGGRLHSAEVRAQVLAQVAAGDMDGSRLINDQFIFPYAQVAYLQGGYFQAHLATKHGVDKANGFFLANGARYINPLRLNQTFRDHFGQSFQAEVGEHLRNLRTLATRQVSGGGVELMSRPFVGRLNHDRERIWWVDTDGTEPSSLRVFQKSTRSLTSELLDLPLGKVFWRDDRPLSASSDQNDLFRQEYSLYEVGSRIDPKYRGQIVTDQRAGRTVGLLAYDAWLDPQVISNGEPYDIGHSHPILDDDGHVYVFRQKGNERLLFRDRQPLFKYEGTYGRLTEVSSDGTIYFLANTETGSSLYRYRQHEIMRVLASDRVVDARLINDKEVLAVEIESRGHRISRLPLILSPQVPSVYAYGFPTSIHSALTAPDRSTEKEEEYSAWRELRLSQIDARLGALAGRNVADVTALWADPLEFHNLTLNAASGYQRNDQQLRIAYEFTRDLPDYYAFYQLSRGPDHWGQVGIKLPFWRWMRWDAKADVAAAARSGRHGVFAGADLIYSVPVLIGFFPWRDFKLNVNQRWERSNTGVRTRFDSTMARLHYTHGFSGERYLDGTASFVRSNTDDIWVTSAASPLTMDFIVPRLGGRTDYSVWGAVSARLEAHQVLNVHWYDDRLPVGLDRMSIFGVGHHAVLQRRDRVDVPQTISEGGLGLEAQLLVLHRFRTRLRVLQSIDRDAVTSTNVGLGFSQSF